MILFVAAYPNKENEKDGFIQRVKYIDNFFIDIPRIYIEVSKRKFFLPRYERRSNLTIIKINLFFHFFLIIYYSFLAKTIYVHSVYNAINILPIYLIRKKIITDMHGVVPEELLQEGKKLKSFIFGIIEYIIAVFSDCIIVCTKQMEKHFQKKYNINLQKIILIPYVDNKIENIDKMLSYCNNTVIYSGGIHKWQNIDLMLAAIKKVPNLKYILLTGNLIEFNNKIKQNGLQGILNVKSVSKNEVYNFYKQADYGFVLRDNNLINNVACPTKLIEYMSYGVIPIVLQPNIGDFNELGYSYINLNEFIEGRLPDIDQLAEMKRNNLGIINKLYDIAQRNFLKVRNEVLDSDA